jgi:hypothetical protein
MIDQFSDLIPQSIRTESGSVFYSGKTAFGAQSDLYILGLNPGGSPHDQRTETVQWHTDKVLNEESPDWSAYRDESWANKPPGSCGMQPRVLHMLHRLKLEPGRVPASNVVFVRTPREKNLHRQFNDLAALCWPVHEAVIQQLGIRVVLCFGKRAGSWVRSRLGAHEFIDEFTESNNRRWKSISFRNSAGVIVVVATHPSIADWTTTPADPTVLVERVLPNIFHDCSAVSQ